MEFRLACYALLRNGRGEVLLLQREQSDAAFSGRWEFPGGKVEAGESVSQALRREVKEESGLEPEVAALAGAVDFPIGAFRVIMLVFEAAAADGAVTLSREHQAWRWVRPERIAELDLTDPVRHFLEMYQGRDGRRSV